VNVSRHIAIIGDFDPTLPSHRAIRNVGRLGEADSATLYQPEVSALAARTHPLVLTVVHYVTEDDDVQSVA
jgi:hypothetical protein